MSNTLAGEVSSISKDNVTATVVNDDEIYYVNIDTDKSKTSIKVGSSIIVYGNYKANDDETGFPMIISEWKEG